MTKCNKDLHEMTDENTINTTNGPYKVIRCRECKRESDRRYNKTWKGKARFARTNARRYGKVSA